MGAALYWIKTVRHIAHTGIFSGLQSRVCKFTKTFLFTRRAHKGFKGTFVNRGFPSLYGGSLKSLLTVPLMQWRIFSVPSLNLDLDLELNLNLNFASALILNWLWLWNYFWSLPLTLNSSLALTLTLNCSWFGPCFWSLHLP